MSEPKPPPGGTPDNLSEAAIQALLATKAAARRTVPLDQLWIRVDGRTSSRPQKTGDGGVSIIAGELDDFVEISAVAGSKRVPLLSFSLFNETRSFSRSGDDPTWQRNFTTRIEGGRRISITIRPTKGLDGLPAYELVAQPVPARSFVAVLATLPMWQKVVVSCATVVIIGLILFVVSKVANNFMFPEPQTGMSADKRPTPSGTISTTQTPLPSASPTPGTTASVQPQVEPSPQQSTPPSRSEQETDNEQRAFDIVDPGLPNGLRGLPEDISSEVSAAIENPGGFSIEPQRKPPTKRFTLMGNSEGRAFRLKEPLGVVVRNDRPTLTWDGPSERGEYEYSVVIRDLDTDEIAASTEAPIRGTSWTPKNPLTRGKSYGWFVSTTQNGKTIYAPAAGQGTFKVLDLNAEQLLRRAESVAPRSLLVRAVLLYRAGLIQESAEAFAQLEALNPNSRTIKALRKRIEESRRSK